METAHPAHPSRFHTFTQIAMFLAVVTGVEIVIIFLPLADWIVYGSLGVLSLVKFLAVIFYFMHLRWDRVLCTILFFIGLAMGGGTVGSFLLLFMTDRTEAAADRAAAEEARTEIPPPPANGSGAPL